MTPRDRVTMGPLARAHEGAIMGMAAALRDVDEAARRLARRYGWTYDEARAAVLEVCWTRRQVPPWCPRPGPDVARARAVSEVRRGERREVQQQASLAFVHAPTGGGARPLPYEPHTPPHKRRRCDTAKRDE